MIYARLPTHCKAKWKRESILLNLIVNKQGKLWQISLTTLAMRRRMERENVDLFLFTNCLMIWIIHCYDGQSQSKQRQAHLQPEKATLW